MTLTLVNNCPFIICPAIQPDSSHPVLERGGFCLRALTHRSFSAPRTPWSGWIWARIDCTHHHSFTCAIDDCGSRLECLGLDGAPPATLAQVSLHHGGPHLDLTSYGVSVIDGFNLPLTVSKQNPKLSSFDFSSSNGKSLSFPRPPLFWPWEKVKVGPLSVSPMGFGTWAWGNKLFWGYEEEMDGVLQETFNLAVKNGINLFDTADSYGTGKLTGQSERLLGKFIREYQGPYKVRDNIVIATKFAAYPWRLTSGQFVKACKSSLDRLELDQIGIGQLHWSTANYAPLQESALWDGLVAMYEKGLVRAVGVSNYGPKQLIKIHGYLKSRGVPLCSAQVQFSLLSMGNDQRELKEVCDSLGIRIISYSPLGLGMLTGKYTASNLPRGPRGLLFRQILPGLDPLLSSLKGIAQRRGKTMSQVAINWCICKGTIPIPGVKTVEQAEENLGSLGWRLRLDEISELESAVKNSTSKMIQNIFQTR